MPHSYSKTTSADGGSSIEPTNIEEGGNPVADDGGLGQISTEAEQEARPTGVEDHNGKIMREGLENYTGVGPSGANWKARVSNGTDAQGKKKRVHLGTFRTPQIAAIAFDTAVLHLKGEKAADRLNFPQFISDIQSILKGCSPSKSDENLKIVARKGANDLAPLVKRHQGLEVSAPMPDASSNATSSPMISTNRGMPYSTSNTDFRVSNANFSLGGHGLEASSLISLYPYDEGMDVLAQILAATSGAPSTPTISSNTGIFDSTSTVDFPVVPFQVKQRIKASTRASGSIRAVSSNEHQPRAQIHDDRQEAIFLYNSYISESRYM